MMSMMLNLNPADWWIWCVLAGHNPDDDGKCQRCGEQTEDTR